MGFLGNIASIGKALFSPGGFVEEKIKLLPSIVAEAENFDPEIELHDIFKNIMSEILGTEAGREWVWRDDLVKKRNNPFVYADIASGLSRSDALRFFSIYLAAIELSGLNILSNRCPGYFMQFNELKRKSRNNVS